MFWTDEIIEDIIKTIPKDAYLVTDWMTTSGHAHIGSLRGAIIHNLIRFGLEQNGKKAEFQWGFDDFDPMDGKPAYLDDSWLEHMGKPLCNIPAPDGKSESFADQYATEFESILEKLYIEPKVTRTSELYKSGQFNESIKIILDNAEKIRQIYKDISGSNKNDNWFPFQVVCPNCGKIGTTLVTGWDGKEVDFTCEENLVTWARGCNYKGKVSPFDGNGKLAWKVEWPSKWFITKTDIEGEGKDHFASGGSRDVADKIFREIFKKTPPYDIRYEHFLVGGAKMSSSKGLGVTALNVSNLLPPNILRFLFVRTKAKRAIDFQVEGETIPLLYDEFDRSASAFKDDPESDLGRAYFYTKLSDEKPLDYILRFSKIAYMLQMPRCDIYEYAEKEKESALSEDEKTEIESRIKIAKMWLDKYAPDTYKFTILDNTPADIKLTKIQKEFLQKISDIIKSQNKWQGEDLHKEIHNIKNEMNIPPRDAFSAIYQVFLGKDSGPQAGWLLASLDKEFVIRRIKEIDA